MGSSRDILPRHTKSGKQPKVALSREWTLATCIAKHALMNQVKVLIGGVHHIDAARKAGRGMKHRAALALVEHADPLTIGGARVRSDIVVERRLMVGFLGDK